MYKFVLEITKSIADHASTLIITVIGIIIASWYNKKSTERPEKHKVIGVILILGICFIIIIGTNSISVWLTNHPPNPTFEPTSIPSTTVLTLTPVPVPTPTPLPTPNPTVVPPSKPTLAPRPTPTPVPSPKPTLAPAPTSTPLSAPTPTECIFPIWHSGESYNDGVKVMYNNKIYKCNKSHTALTPPLNNQFWEEDK